MSEGRVTILPAQAYRISEEAAKTGAAVGVSQSGSTLTINTGRETFRIGAAGQDLPHPEQEKLC